MDLLQDIVRGDRTDLALIHVTLETLINLVTPGIDNDEGILPIYDVLFSFNALVCCI